MTGNTAKVGVAAAQGNWVSSDRDPLKNDTVTLFAAYLVAFFLGSLLAWSVASKPRRKKGSFRYLAVLVLGLFILVTVLCHLLTGSYWEIWSSVIIPFAMGIVDVVNFSGWLGYHVIAFINTPTKE